MSDYRRYGPGLTGYYWEYMESSRERWAKTEQLNKEHSKRMNDARTAKQQFAPGPLPDRSEEPYRTGSSNSSSSSSGRAGGLFFLATAIALFGAIVLGVL